MAKLLFLLKLWLCVWVVVTGINVAVGWTGMVLPMVFHSLVVSGITVPVMVFVVIPLLQRKRREG